MPDVFKLAQKANGVDYASVSLGHSIHFFVLVAMQGLHLVSNSWQCCIAVFKTKEVLQTNEVVCWPLKVICPRWYTKTWRKSVRQDVLGFVLVTVFICLRIFVIMAPRVLVMLAQLLLIVIFLLLFLFITKH